MRIGGDDGPLINLRRIGKHAAGRLLDGREWNEVPDQMPGIRDQEKPPMRERFRPDHARRHPVFGSPCRIGPEPHRDNVCSMCGGAVPEVPLILFGGEPRPPRPGGDIDVWIYCRACGDEMLRRLVGPRPRKEKWDER